MLVSALRLIAQDIGIDRDGESVFSFYSLNEYRLEFDTEEPLSVGFSTYRFRTTFTRDADTTVIKNKGLFIKLSMLNSDDKLVLTDLSELKPGFGTKIGYQISIESFKDIDQTPKGTYTLGGNVVFEVDNFSLFDTSDSTIKKQYPKTYGLEFNFAHFSKSKLRNIIAANLSILRTWNDDDLINYSDKSKAKITSSVVALKDFDGRFGDLKNNLTKVRLSISSPFYYKYLNPIPYAVLNVLNGDASVILGTFVNILAKPLESKDYNIPSSLGIGIDWQYSKDEGWTSASIFIKGAINFSKFK